MSCSWSFILETGRWRLVGWAWLDFELDRVIIGDGSVVRGFVGFVVTHAIPELEGVILRLCEIQTNRLGRTPA